MSEGNFVQIAPLMREPGVMEIKTPEKLRPSANGAQILGIDVGSTTCKYVLASASGEIISQAYETAQHQTSGKSPAVPGASRSTAWPDAEARPGLLHWLGSRADRSSGRWKVIQEVVAVAASVERLHPAVRFVSEIGGEDMKTIFFNGERKNEEQASPDAERLLGRHRNIHREDCAQAANSSEQLSEMRYTGHTLHKISSKCGIFAEADANTLLKAGVTVDEIIASLFEAVVYQNLATLTRGNTPSPEVLLLGGPNLFFKGLQEAWRLHLTRIWKERKVQMPGGKDPESMINVPQDALYYAALGCIEVALRRTCNSRRLPGRETAALVD